MQYIPFDSGIEVNGQTVYAIVDGFSAFRALASEILIAEQIGKRGPDGLVEVDYDQWYSQAAWLRAFERISKELGEGALFQIGLAIPLNAKFPEWVHDVESAVRSIDVAYHMNHRKNGVELLDAQTGTMFEGIGHYGCKKVESDRLLISVCKNPYPCAFNRGIITAVAARFAPLVKVAHDDRKPCRNKGADSCTYFVLW